MFPVRATPKAEKRIKTERKKERKNTDKPREGWEAPHRDFDRSEYVHTRAEAN